MADLRKIKQIIQSRYPDVDCYGEVIECGNEHRLDDVERMLRNMDVKFERNLSQGAGDFSLQILDSEGSMKDGLSTFQNAISILESDGFELGVDFSYFDGVLKFTSRAGCDRAAGLLPTKDIKARGFDYIYLNDSAIADGVIVAGEGRSMDGIPFGVYVQGGKRYRGFEITSSEGGLRKGFYRFYNWGSSGIPFGNSATDGQFSTSDFERLISEGKIKLLDAVSVSDAAIAAGSNVKVPLKGGSTAVATVLSVSGGMATVRLEEGEHKGLEMDVATSILKDKAIIYAPIVDDRVSLSNLPDSVSREEFDSLYQKLRGLVDKKWDYRVSTYGDRSKIEVQKAVGAYQGTYGPVGGRWKVVKTIYCRDATRKSLIEKLRTVSVPYGERYQVTDGSGWSFDLQHRGMLTYEEVTKYPRVSPKESSMATLRFWYNGEYKAMFKGPINTVKAEGIAYLQKQLQDSETVGEFDLDNLPSEDGEQKVKLHTGGKVIEVEVESEEHEREERLGDSAAKYSYDDFVNELKKLGLEKHSSTLFAEAKRGLDNLRRVKEISGGWWKNVDVDRIYLLSMKVNDSAFRDKAIDRKDLKKGMRISWKHHGEAFGGVVKEVEQRGSYTTVHYERERDGVGASFAFENEPITLNDSKRAFTVKDKKGRELLVFAADSDEAVRKVRALKDVNSDFPVGTRFRWKRDNYKSYYTVVKVENAPSEWGGKHIYVKNESGDAADMPLGNFREVLNVRLIKDKAFTVKARTNDFPYGNNLATIVDANSEQEAVEKFRKLLEARGDKINSISARPTTPSDEARGITRLKN